MNYKVKITPKIRANLAISITVIFWGMSFVSSKAVLNTGIPPFTMAFLRFLIASALLFPVYKKLEPDKRMRIKTREFPILLISALFGVTIYFLFETIGIKLTSASTASMIIASIPVFTVCAEFAIYRKRIPPLKWLGVLLSVAGVYFIIKEEQVHQSTPESFIGNLLMLGACISWVIYIIASKSIRKSFSGLALTTYQTLLGTLFLLPLALLEHDSWISIPAIAWFNILYLAVFCSAISYFLYIYSLTYLDSVIVSSYTNLIPVVSTFGGIFILGEKIMLRQILGGLIVIAGVFIVNLNKPSINRIFNRTVSLEVYDKHP